MDPSSIPKQYGGELEWQWGDMPYLDEEARKVVGVLESPPAEGETKPNFIKGPILFKGDHVEILGKVNGESRKSNVPVGATPAQSNNNTSPVQVEKPTEQESSEGSENEKVPLQEPAPASETETQTVTA